MTKCTEDDYYKLFLTREYYPYSPNHDSLYYAIVSEQKDIVALLLKYIKPSEFNMNVDMNKDIMKMLILAGGPVDPDDKSLILSDPDLLKYFLEVKTIDIERHLPYGLIYGPPYIIADIILGWPSATEFMKKLAQLAQDVYEKRRSAVLHSIELKNLDQNIMITTAYLLAVANKYDSLANTVLKRYQSHMPADIGFEVRRLSLYGKDIIGKTIID